MAKVSIDTKQFFTGSYDFHNSLHVQELQSITSRFLDDCLALGAKVDESLLERHKQIVSVHLQCTPKQLKGVFSLRDSVRVWFSTTLAEAKCKRVFKLLKGTGVTKDLSYGSFYHAPCSICGYVTSYEDYQLIMSTVKDVRKNYTVVQRVVKI